MCETLLSSLPNLDLFAGNKHPATSSFEVKEVSFQLSVLDADLLKEFVLVHILCHLNSPTSKLMYIGHESTTINSDTLAVDVR